MNATVPWLLWQKCEFVELLILWCWWNGAAPVVAHYWRSRMTPGDSAKAWPWSYWAVLMTSTPFGPITILPFGLRTRGARGALPGILLAVALVAGYFGLALLLPAVAEEIFGDAANPPL